jgi:5,10-methylenetetrahydromethanopterin reductase
LADVGVAFDGRSPVPSLLGLARAAEAAGAGSLWIASHLFLRDAIASAALVLGATAHARVVLMAVSPYTVHPVQAAMTAATLEEAFPGRVALCYGLGVPGDLAAAGLAPDRPVATLRDALALTRALLAGAPVRYRGTVFRAEGRALAAARPVPLYLAAAGPQTLALAGQAADGVVVSAGSSVPCVGWALARVAGAAAGRAPRRVGLVYTRAAERGAEARDGARRSLAVVLRSPHHARNVALGGTGLDQARLAAAVAAENWPAAAALVTDEVVARHAAAGTAAEVRARLAAYRAAGLDEIVLAGLSDADDIRRALGAALPAVPEDRRGAGAPPSGAGPTKETG